MDVRRKGLHGLAALVSAAILAVLVAGCSGDDGIDGADGQAGTPGTDGISCWDLNENGVPDLPDEDTNGDGVVNVEDCRAPGGAYDPAGLHAGFFKENPYEGTQDCLYCHGKIADEILETGHWNWQGVAANLEGFEAEIHGKNDIINNFCIAVPSNEGRCTQCHIGYGYADKTFNFQDPKNIDCLVCHDQSGTYKKAAPSAGAPDPSVDLQVVAQSVGEGGGIPTRKACLFCHAQAGGGDNVKHGDLYLQQASTTREYDVHMGVDNAVGGFTCTECHAVKKDADGALTSHGIGGMPYHSVDEGAMKTCEDCHGSAASVHAGTSAQSMVAAHPALACQVCHIPAIAREKSTKVEWYWETAGDKTIVPEEDQYGNPLYNWQKGTFVFAKDVRPELRYFDGKWNKALIGVNDTFPTTGPAQLAAPTADRFTPGARIYPFKKMIGNQPVALQGANWKFIVPHLFGTAGGPNPYWVALDWDLALQDGALYTGQFYEPGTYVFAPTEMLLSVNHEVAPKEMALGYQNGCGDCHFNGQIDWEALGCTADPTEVQGACPDND
jgi:octaheme c-type cytochrome (tetrathionate reductase family)